MAVTLTGRATIFRRPGLTARSKLGRANPLGERPTQSMRNAHADETENGDSQGGGGPPDWNDNATTLMTDSHELRANAGCSHQSSVFEFVAPACISA